MSLWGRYTRCSGGVRTAASTDDEAEKDEDEKGGDENAKEEKEEDEKDEDERKKKEISIVLSENETTTHPLKHTTNQRDCGGRNDDRRADNNKSDGRRVVDKSDERGVRGQRSNSEKSSVSAFDGIMRNLAGMISETLWGYFKAPSKPVTMATTTPTTLVSPSYTSPVADTLCVTSSQSQREDEDREASVSGFEEEDEIDIRAIDEVLTSTLGALYARATPTAVKQAWEVLSKDYHGDMRQFQTHFLDPVLVLLLKLQESQGSENPSHTWPLAISDSVVVHLSRRNNEHLRDAGDFCLCTVVNATASTDPIDKCVQEAAQEPALVVCTLCADGAVHEFQLDEEDYGSVLTMEWAKKVREAHDFEVAHLMRQCLVASEYTVRHLRWEDISHQNPRFWSSRHNERRRLAASGGGGGGGGASPSSNGMRHSTSMLNTNELGLDNRREAAFNTSALSLSTAHSCSDINSAASMSLIGRSRGSDSPSAIYLPDSTLDESQTDDDLDSAFHSPSLQSPQKSLSQSSCSLVHQKDAAFFPTPTELSQSSSSHRIPPPSKPSYSPESDTAARGSNSPAIASHCNSSSETSPHAHPSSTDSNYFKSPPLSSSSSSSKPSPSSSQWKDAKQHRTPSSSALQLAISSSKRSQPTDFNGGESDSLDIVAGSVVPPPDNRKTESSSSSSSSSLSSSPVHSLGCHGDVYATWHAGRARDPRHQHQHRSRKTSSEEDGRLTPTSGLGLRRHRRELSTSSSRSLDLTSARGRNSPTSDSSPHPPRSMERSNSSSYLVRRTLDTPTSVCDVNQDLLTSGVAILPGCHDDDGRTLVFIFTCSSLWHERRVTSVDLAQLLMYYHSVPRKHKTDKGMAVVSDIRGSTPSTINVLLEALYLFKDNVPNAVSIVHMFADKATQPYVVKSPLYDSKASLNLKVLVSLEHLQEYIDPHQIPTVLDGLFPYNHESWVRFRKKLESFMSKCRSVACQLMELMEEIASQDYLPRTISEAATLIRTQESKVKAAFDDETLVSLHQDGPTLINALQREHASFNHSQDYRFAMDQALGLHQHLQDCISRLVRLADVRMTKLHNCLQLREYEDECSKVIGWLSQEGQMLLVRHQKTSDNLKSIRHQQKDFENFYFSAMSYVEKGNDLLEEASMLSQCGNFSEATGYKQLARTLKDQLHAFTGQLEESRERIEATSRCYHMLDKSYEWALEAMKYMASINMEHSTTTHGLDKLLRSIHAYLSDHPPISDAHFSSMTEAARRLGNEKLAQQCNVAKSRCQETHHLLQLRLSNLRRARNQLEVEQALSQVETEREPTRQTNSSTTSSPCTAFDVQDMVKPIHNMCQDMSRDYHDLNTGSRDDSSASYTSHSLPSTPLHSAATISNSDANRLPYDSLNSSPGAGSESRSQYSSVEKMQVVEKEPRTVTPECSGTTGTSATTSQRHEDDNDVWQRNCEETRLNDTLDNRVGVGDTVCSPDSSKSQQQQSMPTSSPESAFTNINESNNGFPQALKDINTTSPSHHIHPGSSPSPSSPTSSPNKSPSSSSSPTQSCAITSTASPFPTTSPVPSLPLPPSSPSSVSSSSSSSSSNLTQSPSHQPPQHQHASFPLASSSPSPTQSNPSSPSTTSSGDPLTSPGSSSSSRPYHSVSSMSRLYNSSPTRSSSPAGRQANKGSISQPLSPGHAASPLSRPLKKVLKRATTAPVPMLSSPILEEEPSNVNAAPPATGSAVAAGSASNATTTTREQRTVKSMSLITGSSDSLPSMPEEDEEVENDLDTTRGQEYDQEVKDWTPLPVNSHLHSSTTSPSMGTPTGPMADLRLTEAEMKSRRTVSLIMSEMTHTERDYVRALQFITDHYIPELQRDDVPQMLRGKRTVIFGNLEKIYQFHSHYFLKQLESCQNQPFLVGQIFLQHETMFYLYALYNKNKPKSDVLMMEYGKEFFKQKQMELGDKMDLSSYLLKPVQRMGKYALLLKQLLKECTETEPEYPELKAAEEMVKFQLRHGNDLLAMDSLRDCDVNLQEQGRLLRQEEFLVFQGRKKSMRRIFLFEDLILFSKTRRGRQGQHDVYVYKCSIKTADIGMTETFADSDCKFEIWFRRWSLGENYVLQAPSADVKKVWIKDISKILWRQAIRNRESRINELATMGIGNKPCMDIKPSVDNIQDRSINVSLNNRGARTRNSIAVSSFDYLRNGNKRPHSIVSVSSNSSSGSSSQSSTFGLLGSLNLAFDPLDSPRLNRRSLPYSHESMMITDHDVSMAYSQENQRPTPTSRKSSSSSPAVSSTSSSSTPISTVKSYFNVMKTRVQRHKSSDVLSTDI